MEATYTINPRTGRRILVGGATWRAVLGAAATGVPATPPDARHVLTGDTPAEARRVRRGLSANVAGPGHNLRVDGAVVTKIRRKPTHNEVSSTAIQATIDALADNREALEGLDDEELRAKIQELALSNIVRKAGPIRRTQPSTAAHAQGPRRYAAAPAPEEKCDDYDDETASEDDGADY